MPSFSGNIHLRCFKVPKGVRTPWLTQSRKTRVVLLHCCYCVKKAEQYNTKISSWLNNSEDICVAVVLYFCMQDAQNNSCLLVDHGFDCDVTLSGHSSKAQDGKRNLASMVKRDL